MTKINVTHIAKLANLPITQDEEEKFGKQLSAVLEHIEKLSEVDTQNVPATSQVTGLHNVERLDEASLSLYQAEALMNAKKVHNGYFEVPVIIEEAVE